MMLLIKNGNVVDPSSKRSGAVDILCMNGKIHMVGKNLSIDRADRIIDAKDLIVCPGFVDLHTHLREPGYEYKENIRTGLQAAVAGGFTSVLCMANTLPVNDNSVITEFIIKKGKAEGLANLYPIGAISKGLDGKTLADIGQMAEAGIVGISDDGRCVMDSALMRKALQYARGFNLLVISHAEDETLSGQSSINEGLVATELGLPGSPNAAEEIIVARDIALAELTKSRLHIAHLSTRGSLDLVSAAKGRGVMVSCEVTPHHLILTDESLRDYNTSAKVRPPLRTEVDILALQRGLKEGIIDAIATDHAPHAVFEKEVEFTQAANGLVGLETALSVCLKLVDEKVITLKDLIRLLSTNPAKIAGLKEKGSLEEGMDADITVFDPEEKWTVDTDRFRSKGRNSPFHGWKVKGRVKYTITGGQVVYTS